MIARRYLVAGVATLALTAASVAAITATSGPGPYRASGAWGGTRAGCAAPSSLPGQRVEVLMTDMGSRMRGPMMGGRWMMLVPSRPTVPAGTVTFVAVNRGFRLHELVVLPLAPGASIGQRVIRPDQTVNEAASLGEASQDCGAGAGDGIRPGDAGWVTMTLKPGRYELACNRPRHYGAGMFTELDVS